jgi:hypothetical protein
MEWRIKVRVIRLVKNKSDSPEGDVNSIDLILLDSEVYILIDGFVHKLIPVNKKCSV